MLNTLAWSHDLLNPEERLLFRRLATFRGGATVPSVEAVCAGHLTQPYPTNAKISRDLTPDALPDTVSNLVSQSLLRATTVRGRTRVALLETVREFAWSQVAEKERSELGRRHFHHYLELAELANRHLPGAARGQWLDLLEDDRDNLRAAWSWSRQEARADESLRLANTLGWFWYFRGPLVEGRSWLEAGLAAVDPSAGDAAVRATGLWNAGRLAHLQGQEHVARNYLKRRSAGRSPTGR